nr:MAG TPA: Minor capsid protein [Caudoviricetes sp.]
MIMSYNSNVFQQISSKLVGRASYMEGAAKKAAKQCAEHLLEESTEQVPVDTGALVLSGEVVDKGTSFDVVYSATPRDRHLLDPSKPLGSNPDYNYALIQHEATWFNHPNGGKDHYLSDPFNANKQRYISIISAGVREALASSISNVATGFKRSKDVGRGSNKFTHGRRR